MELLKTLLSVRLNLRRMTEVLYQAPGFLHGTYMLQKHGRVTQADLIEHAIKMRYGDDAMMMLDGEAAHVAMMIKVLEVR